MNIYTDLPATLRGSNLESHTGWPRQWSTPDVQHAMRVAVALRHVIALGGIDGFVYDVVAKNDDVTITLDRKFSL